MINTVNTKVLEISKTLLQKIYPDVECFVLTGSQVEIEYVSIVSDIDILIIDSNISGVSSNGIKYEGFRVDFTRVGLYSLNEILLDSCYSDTNTIINMIINGIFIQDKNNIEYSIKNYCKEIYNTDLNYYSEFVSLRRALLKVKKNFTRELHNYQIPLTLADFLLNISKAYLFFNNNGKYGFDGYRRSKLLANDKKSQLFLNSVNEISTNFLIDNNPKYIISKVESFLDFSLLNLKKNNTFRFVVNLSFNKNNYYKLIDLLLNNHILLNSFSYAQKVYINSVFRNEYIFVFKEADFNYVSNELEVIVKTLNISNFQYKTVDPFFIMSLWKNLEMIEIIEEIFRNVNRHCIDIVNTVDQNNFQKFLPLFLYILECIRLDHNVSKSMLCNIIKNLRAKYKSRIYFKNINGNKIGKANKIIENIDKQYIRINNDLIKIFSEDIKSNIFINNMDSYNSFFIDLRISINKISCYSNFELLEHEMILYSSFDPLKPKHFYKYFHLIDECLKSFGITDDDFSNFLVIADEIYK